MSFLRTTATDIRDDSSGTIKDFQAQNHVAGRAIGVSWTWETTDTTVTVTDTATNVYVPGTKKKSLANNQWVQQFYVPIALGNAANVVRVTMAVAADFRGGDCASWSYANTFAFDNEGSGEQVAGTTLTMLLTPTGVGANLLFTGSKSFNANVFQNGYAAPWSSISTTLGPTELHHAEDQPCTGVTPINGGAVCTGISNIIGTYMIFKEISGGGGGGIAMRNNKLGIRLGMGI